ncbi:hypothetical protein BJ322DRAFT_715569 [Thelephora terrestris]|uniref:Pre-mRNA polyadenylation factor Fip1 domain-containing protein n=1 Tax=Thelephora terrestris TaxID=56493 RepID=A0A9P6HHU8_9AGAM|nr:hypothetical protein BJ322DRAFT_715569 [Thelephora terrestris]
MDSDDDEFLYGSSAKAELVPPSTTLEPLRSSAPAAVPPNSFAMEDDAIYGDAGDTTPTDANADANGENEEEPHESDGGAEDEDEDSEDDVEFIMEHTSMSLDLRQPRQGPPRTTSVPQAPKPQPSAPAPSLTTEYTPRERGRPTMSQPPPPISALPQQQEQPAQSSTQPIPVQEPIKPTTETDSLGKDSQGTDPNTLPPATAPPSHPNIDPNLIGTLDGRSILEVDLNSLNDKPWRRPGSDISDWFNYGFDEISWEAYCYRRKELGDLATVLKANILNLTGMPEEQVTALPAEIRSVVMASAANYMNNGANPAMMAQNPGMGMPMMGDMGMNMPQMSMMNAMNPADMSGMQMGMPMQDNTIVQGHMPQEHVAGDGFPGSQAAMMGMAGGEFAMQDPTVVMQQQMQQQIFSGMETVNAPVQPQPVRPIPTGPTSLAGPTGPSFRGRAVALGPRGRGGFQQRGGRVGQAPIRSTSPLPPNVPTGPRNQNKYKDRDGLTANVDGLDYGGGGGGRDANNNTPPEERSRKRRASPVLEDGRSKRR